MVKIDELVAEARDSLTVRRVYGDPIEKNGVTLIPAAAVKGGAGGGEGGDSSGEGAGGGFGMMAKPAGAFRIKGDEVTWIPASDPMRVAMLGQVVGIVALLVIRSIFKSLRARRASAD